MGDAVGLTEWFARWTKPGNVKPVIGYLVAYRNWNLGKSKYARYVCIQPV